MKTRLRAVTLPAICALAAAWPALAETAEGPSGACDPTADAQCALTEARALREQGKTREALERGRFEPATGWASNALAGSPVDPATSSGDLSSMAGQLSGWLRFVVPTGMGLKPFSPRLGLRPTRVLGAHPGSLASGRGRAAELVMRQVTVHGIPLESIGYSAAGQTACCLLQRR